MKSRQPIILLFDAGPLVASNKAGVGYYTKRLIESLADQLPENSRLVGHYFNFLGMKSVSGLPCHPSISYKNSNILPHKALTAARLLGFQLPVELLFKQTADAALFPNFLALPSALKIPKVSVIHDTAFLDMPELVPDQTKRMLSRHLGKSIKRSDQIITVSEFSKKSIIKHFGVEESRVLVTPIPPESLHKKITSKRIIDGKYLLFLGTLEPRKNIACLLTAYHSLPAKVRQEYSLVLAGGKGWKDEEILALIDKFRLQGDSIITPGYVSDQDKDSLLKHTAIYVQPSLYEGFGMPILEAMSYDIPIVCSDIDVFKEVAGDSVQYFKNNNSVNLTAKLDRLIKDKGLQKLTVEKSRSRLSSLPGWEDVADAVIDSIYRQINK